MRRFLGSAWFAFLTVLVFALATVGMFAVLKPNADALSDEQMEMYLNIGGWAAGPVLALLSFLLVLLLNGIRRLTKSRKVYWLHPIILVLGLLPWFLFGWQLTMNEPRYTSIANVIIDFFGKEMLVGSFVAIVFALVLSLPGFFLKDTK